MQPRKTTVLHMKRLNQTESPIFVILCSLFPKAILFDFYFICGVCFVIICSLSPFGGPGKCVLADYGISWVSSLICELYRK